MHCQQTQKLEATLLLVSQDLQERWWNPSGPRTPHLWEGGRCPDKATESQNSRKRNGRSGESDKSSFKSSILTCNLNDTLGNVEKHEPATFQVHLHQFLADHCQDLFPFAAATASSSSSSSGTAGKPHLEHTCSASYCIPQPLCFSECIQPHSPQHLFHRCWRKFWLSLI